jgi:hypothetical protein
MDPKRDPRDRNVLTKGHINKRKAEEDEKADVNHNQLHQTRVPDWVYADQVAVDPELVAEFAEASRLQEEERLRKEEADQRNAARLQELADNEAFVADLFEGDGLTTGVSPHGPTNFIRMAAEHSVIPSLQELDAFWNSMTSEPIRDFIQGYQSAEQLCQWLTRTNQGIRITWITAMISAYQRGVLDPTVLQGDNREGFDEDPLLVWMNYIHGLNDGNSAMEAVIAMDQPGPSQSGEARFGSEGDDSSEEIDFDGGFDY